MSSSNENDHVNTSNEFYHEKSNLLNNNRNNNKIIFVSNKNESPDIK